LKRARLFPPLKYIALLRDEIYFGRYGFEWHSDSIYDFGFI
jgi:hypothetical protein